MMAAFCSQASENRNGPNGCFSLMMTCLGVGVSIFSMNLPAVLKRGPNLLLISSSVNLTSSEVTGLPSCHFASTRSKR